jgi:hypothetical protein
VGNPDRAVPASRSADDSESDFDPHLGLILGDTWWKLGKNFAAVLTVDGESRNQQLEDWAAAVRAELAEDGMNEPIGGVTGIAIEQFVGTVMDLLEKKFDGKDIACDVQRLTEKANDFRVTDAGRYLDIQEPADVFWAVEYDFLFSRLDKSLGGGGWLSAVARCADADCGAFFIKSRSDQRHHTPGCRTRSANRQAYGERTGLRSHTKRGRPRLRRQ